jgi:hypothetical protein
VRPNLIKAGLYTLWLWMLVMQLWGNTRGFWGTLRPRSDTGALVQTFIVAAAVCLLGSLVMRVARNGITARPLAVRAAIAITLLTLAIRLDLVQYWRWFRTRTHVMVESGTDLDRALPADAVLVGGWAPALLIGSKHRAVAMTDWANSDDPVGRFGATHLVTMEDGPDIKRFSRLYPGMMERAAVFRQYAIGGTPLIVYELPRPDEHQPQPKPSR